MLNLTREQIELMSDTEVITTFSLMKQMQEVAKMRKALIDIADIDEANVNIIKLEK